MRKVSSHTLTCIQYYMLLAKDAGRAEEEQGQGTRKTGVSSSEVALQLSSF